MLDTLSSEEDDDITRSRHAVPHDADAYQFELMEFKGSPLRATQQVHSLVSAAKQLGVTKGCTIRDTQTGLRFRWRPMSCPSGSDS